MIDIDHLFDELGQLLGIHLQPDLHKLCTILVAQTFKVQLQLDDTDETILISAIISELPPGRFRENILKDALKVNYGYEKSFGVLSYIEKDNVLVLFDHLPTGGLTALILYHQIAAFAKRLNSWKSAIDNGETCPREELPQKSDERKPSLFGF